MVGALWLTGMHMLTNHRLVAWGCSPESNVAVVSHCGLLFYMLASFGHECGESIQNYLHKGFDNCELRSIVLCDASGVARPNPTWFPGGRMCLHSP